MIRISRVLCRNLALFGLFSTFFGGVLVLLCKKHAGWGCECVFVREVRSLARVSLFVATRGPPYLTSQHFMGCQAACSLQKPQLNSACCICIQIYMHRWCLRNYFGFKSNTVVCCMYVYVSVQWMMGLTAHQKSIMRGQAELRVSLQAHSVECVFTYSLASVSLDASMCRKHTLCFFCFQGFKYDFQYFFHVFGCHVNIYTTKILKSGPKKLYCNIFIIFIYF